MAFRRDPGRQSGDCGLVILDGTFKCVARGNLELFRPLVPKLFSNIILLLKNSLVREIKNVT